MLKPLNLELIVLGGIFHAYQASLQNGETRLLLEVKTYVEQNGMTSLNLRELEKMRRHFNKFEAGLKKIAGQYFSVVSLLPGDEKPNQLACLQYSGYTTCIKFLNINRSVTGGGQKYIFPLRR